MTQGLSEPLEALHESLLSLQTKLILQGMMSAWRGVLLVAFFGLVLVDGGALRDATVPNFALCFTSNIAGNSGSTAYYRRYNMTSSSTTSRRFTYTHVNLLSSSTLSALPFDFLHRFHPTRLTSL